jgi:DNA-binding MarR family transcriptional regulator
MHDFHMAFRQSLIDVLQPGLSYSAEGTGQQLYQLFFLPGEYLLLLASTYAPELVARLGSSLLDPRGDLSQILSALTWLALFLSIGPVRHRIKMYFRVLSEILKVVRYSIHARLHVTRSMRESFLNRISMGHMYDGIDVSEETNLSKLDIAVLEAEAELAPGFSHTAPDIAALLRVRPAQAQESLDKLKKLDLISDSFGTQDGYSGYQITESGRFIVTSAGLKKAPEIRPSA